MRNIYLGWEELWGTRGSDSGVRHMVEAASHDLKEDYRVLDAFSRDQRVWETSHHPAEGLEGPVYPQPHAPAAAGGALVPMGTGQLHSCPLQVLQITPHTTHTQSPG